MDNLDLLEKANKEAAEQINWISAEIKKTKNIQRIRELRIRAHRESECLEETFRKYGEIY